MNLHITEINQTSKLKVNMSFGLFNSTYEFIFKKKFLFMLLVFQILKQIEILYQMNQED